jgi:hypothetical protein
MKLYTSTFLYRGKIYGACIVKAETIEDAKKYLDQDDFCGSWTPPLFLCDVNGLNGEDPGVILDIIDGPTANKVWLAQGGSGGSV